MRRQIRGILFDLNPSFALIRRRDSLLKPGLRSTGKARHHSWILPPWLGKAFLDRGVAIGSLRAFDVADQAGDQLKPF